MARFKMVAFVHGDDGISVSILSGSRKAVFAEAADMVRDLFDDIDETIECGDDDSILMQKGKVEIARLRAIESDDVDLVEQWNESPLNRHGNDGKTDCACFGEWRGVNFVTNSIHFYEPDIDC